MKDRKYIQKGGLITKDIFNNEHSKTIFQSTVFQLFNLRKKLKDSDFANCFEEWTKLRVPSETKPPLLKG